MNDFPKLGPGRDEHGDPVDPDRDDEIYALDAEDARLGPPECPKCGALVYSTDGCESCEVAAEAEFLRVLGV